MTDAQWLLVVAALIYLSDCLVWLPRGAVAVVLPLAGSPIVRMPSAWAGNERGGLAFTTLLPARAVFVCDGDGFRMRAIAERANEVTKSTRRLRVLAVAAFISLFVIAPLLSWRFGFAQIGLLLIAAFLIVNVVIALVFFRAHKRVRPKDRLHRWAHTLVMVIATPTAIRSVDHVSRDLLREFDPLAVAAKLAGEDHPLVRKLLRELAHPAGGAEPGPRYDEARKAGLEHVDEAPEGASRWCPRCLARYEEGRDTCVDCELPLRGLVTSPAVHGSRRRSRP
jgi:hypothetical protein